MNEKEYQAFISTAKRIKDSSKGKMTMEESRRELAKHLTKASNMKEKNK